MKSKLSILLIVLILLSLGSWFIWGHNSLTQQKLEHKISAIDQNPDHYVPAHNAPALTAAQQQQMTQDFLSNYFSPWDMQPPAIVQDKKQKTLTNFQEYLKNPGWGENLQPQSANVIQTLYQNANLDTYPNLGSPGIIVRDTDLRVLPTVLPLFWDPKKAGEGYPFDNLQNSLMVAGSPVYVLHKTKDGLWYLISVGAMDGWIPSQDVAFASPNFIQEWKNHPYLITIRDAIPLVNDRGLALAPMRVGVLYPNVGQEGQQVKILMPIKNAEGDADLMTLSADNGFLKSFPVPATVQNIAQLMKNFQGTLYGWGGLYQLRDCSAMVKDLFAGFGIWLPRNSGGQAQTGQVIPLTQMSSEQKLAVIKDQGIPFFTVLHFPGHTAIYLGVKDGRVYLLQDAWGIHSTNVLGKEGRIIMGRTFIAPMDFAKGYYNVKKTLLDRADSMSILYPPAPVLSAGGKTP